MVLTAHNQGGRSSQQSGRSICRSKCLILIGDHDLVLVLTAHNRGGHNCLQRGTKTYSRTIMPFHLRNLCLSVYVLTMSARGGRRISRDLAPFLCIATHFLLPLRYKGLERTIKNLESKIIAYLLLGRHLH